eukprot:1718167-Rhodomonas_salina.1
MYVGEQEERVTGLPRSGNQGTMTGAAGMKGMDSTREVEEAQQEVVHSTRSAPPQQSAEQMLGAKT